MLVESYVRLKNYLYDRRYLRTLHLPAFVISVGNITWGGTGKTALILEIGRHLLERGERLAVISRGYGRSSTGVRLVSDGRQILESWQTAGDEAYLVAQNLPSAVVVVSERRADAFRVLQAYDPQVVLLDDAFQHRKVARNLDLVLVDATEEPSKQRLIPFGKLREPIDSLQRADAVILTHAFRAEAKTQKWLRQNTDAPFFRADYMPVQNLPSGKNLAAFCAIGSPHHFFSMLEDQGARLVYRRSFRDHHIYRNDELLDLQQEARKSGADVLVTTPKDAVKIPSGCLDLPLVVAEARLVIREGDGFYDWLIDRLRSHASSL